MNQRHSRYGRSAAAFSLWMIKHRWPLLFTAMLLSAAAWLPAQRLGFDRSIENMFRPDDPLLPAYRLLKRTFGGDEVVLVAYTDPELLTDGGIERVAELTRAVQKLPGVQDVLSLSNSPEGHEIISGEGRAALFLEFFAGYHIGSDQQTTGLAAVLNPNQSSSAQATTVNAIRSLADAHHPRAVMVGGPVMVVEGFRLVEEDGERLGWLSTILLAATIAACFRSLRWTIAAILVVNMTLLLTKALLVATQFRLTIVSSLLWTNVTVIGIATIMHILIKFRETHRPGKDPKRALWLVGAILVPPIMWTCLTDAAGFGSLMAAEVSPVRDFGFMMVIAALLSMVSLTTLLPGLLLWGRRDIDPHRTWGESVLDNILNRMVGLAIRRAGLIVFVTVLLAVWAVMGCYRLEVETDFTKNFRSRSDIVQAYGLVETRLGGAGVWDVIVPAPPPESLNTRYIKRIRWLERRLRREVLLDDGEGNQVPGLTKVIGLVDAFDAFGKGRGVARDVILRLKHRKVKEQMPVVAASLYGEDTSQPGKHFFRIMLRARERQSSAAKRDLIEQVTRISREVFPGSENEPTAEITGFFVLLTRMIDSVVQDQWTTFSLAVLAIGLLMWIAFRSPWLAIASLIPNILPVIVVTGALGWLGLKINMGAAMVAAVSMGLSVDAEIHYVTAFQRLLRSGFDPRTALTNVQQSVGRAVAFSTLTLTVGFAALMVSDFIPTIYFGSLITLTTVGGLLGNLVLLPVLLHLITGRASRP